ncbi:MAG: SGNH/GDSL hydrolase family protein [Rhodospirillales bacterium]|nr:SGNH/GDSL hydrolase family protein [Alphaproteobacteria bacterium]USO04004.1 MAG: SGNH/GDSL hydrolase family protein [Rhodospirillales bacterium]
MKNLLKNTALALFSILITALLIEGLSRLVYPIQYGHKYFDLAGGPLYVLQEGPALKPDMEFRQITQEFNKLTTHTARGFRGPAGGFMDPGQPHTIFIGDSMTYGIGLADLETIPAQYCRLKKRDCINLGQPGSSTYDQVKTLKYFLSTYRWRPKQVYLMMNVMTSALFSGNDLTDNLNDVLQADKKPDQDNASIEHAEQSVKKPVRIHHALLGKSNLARLGYYIFAPVLRTKLAPDMERQQLLDALEATKLQLLKLDALSRKYGFQTRIYIVHPMQDLTRGTYMKTVEDIRGIAPHTDVIGTGPALLDTGNPVEYYYPLDGHVRPSAAEKIAEFMARN